MRLIRDGGLTFNDHIYAPQLPIINQIKGCACVDI